jgi:hypothetical protein
MLQCLNTTWYYYVALILHMVLLGYFDIITRKTQLHLYYYSKRSNKSYNYCSLLLFIKFDLTYLKINV